MILPSAPLLAQLPGRSAAEIAAELGVDRRTVVRWRGGGNVATRDADRLAVAAGAHAFELWPELAAARIAEVQATCRCGDTFIVTRKGHLFCSERCRRQARRKREREVQRERYRTDPEVRARKIAQTRAYRAEAKEALARVQRAKYRANADELRAKRRARYAANSEAEKQRQARYRARLREEGAA